MADEIKITIEQVVQDVKIVVAEFTIPGLISSDANNALVLGADKKLFVPISGGGTSDLALTANPTNNVVSNTNGTGFTIPLADATNAGLLKPAKFSLLELTTEAFTTALKTAYDGVVTDLSVLLSTGQRLITTGEINKLAGIYDWVITNVEGTPNLGAITPSSTPTGTGAAFWFSTAPGIYTNFGGIEVNTNSLAVIVRNSSGTFTVSQTAFNLSDYYSKSNSIIPLDKTDFYSLSANRYNKNATRNDGFYLRGGDGVVTANATSSFTDYIPVVAGEVLKVSGLSYASPSSNFVGVFYDASYVKISPNATGVISTLTFTVPAGAAYFRFNDRFAQATANYDSVMLSLSSVSTYVAYGVFINPERLPVTDTNKINPWTAKAYAVGNQVNHLGRDWVATDVITSTDVPSVSTKWAERLNGYYNKQNSIIPLDKTDFYSLSANRYNKNATRNDGFYLRGGDGVVTANATSSFTDYIPVVAGEVLKVSGLSYASPSSNFVGVFYDASYVKISPNATGVISTLTFTVPAGAAYFRFNDRFVQVTANYDAVMLSLSSVSTYVPYNVMINPSKLPATVIEDNSVTTDKIANTAVTPIKTEMFVLKNQFDKATMVTTGKYLRNGDGVEQTAAEWSYASIPINIALGTSVAINIGTSNVGVSGQMHFFNSVGARIGGSTSMIATIPVGTVMLKINISTTLAALTAVKDSFMVAYGTAIPTVYFDYKYILNQKYISDYVVMKYNVRGSIVRFVGDSITRATGLNGYVAQIVANTGIIATNKGENGATYGNIYPLSSCMSGTQLTYQFDVNTKLCCFFGGTNDFGKDIPIGNNSDGASLIDTTTKGSLWKAIQWVKDNYPLCKILVMTPIERSTNATNAIGLKLIDYRNAIAEICVLQNVECLDLHHNNLISMPTAYKYLYDGLHPNDFGYNILTPIIQEAVVRKLVE